MNSTQNLQSEFSQFIGTEKLYRITSRHVLTDGAKYLAEQAKCFWLMDAIASHLTRSYDEHFAVARLIAKDSSAVLTLDDGNDTVFASQQIDSRIATPSDVKYLSVKLVGTRYLVLRFASSNSCVIKPRFIRFFNLR